MARHKSSSTAASSRGLSFRSLNLFLDTIFCLIKVISKAFIKDGPPESQASVMHPWLASSTTLIYLYKVPCRALSGGAVHRCLRSSSSSADICKSIVFSTASTEMTSPSRTSAIGPPTWASGTTWPITNPWELYSRESAKFHQGHHTSKIVVTVHTLH